MRIFTLIALPVLSLAACSNAPSELVGAARASEELALADGANEYAPEAMVEVAEAKAALDAELAVQEERWALRRSYGEAERLAEAYRMASQHASLEANQAQDAAHATAEALIVDSELLLEEVRGMLVVAPVGKGSAADLAALRGDLDAAEQGLDAARAALLTSTYLEAQSSAGSARELIDRVRSALLQARGARAG
jgi:hypothetical protein